MNKQDSVQLKNLPQKIKKRSTNLAVNLFKYLLLISMAFVFILPFLFMIVTSVKSPYDLADVTISWIPSQLFFKNFVIAFDGLNYVTGVKNSLIVTLLATAGHVISCAMAGYGLARYKFKGRGFFMLFLILTIIVPAQVIITPSYIIFAKMKLINNFLSIVLPTYLGLGLRGGVFIFIFRQFYTGVPAELEEAARVDGCGPVRTFLHIILPISQPPVLVTVILSIVWHWNDSYESVLYMTRPENKLIVSSLPNLYAQISKMATSASESSGGTETVYTVGVVMAATLLVILPVLLVFFILQRKFMQGIERSGIVG